MPDISFCIPTYNFAQFLPETLDSIIAQADDAIEIVIVDGGSTDATDEIVRLYQQKFGNITYYKREKNCGVDRDIAKTVELARGEYCWLFSSDDVLKPGAVKTMRELVCHGNWNALISNFTICDFRMKPLSKHTIFAPAEDFSADWSVAAERLEYLSRARTSTAFFSYISSVVVNRRDWLAAGSSEDFFGSCWIIAAQVMKMSCRNLRVYYHDGELLWKRGDNDSFLSRGIPWRVELSLCGFPRISKAIFGDASPEYEAFRRVTRNEFPFLSILGFKAQLSGNRSEFKSFKQVVKKSWVRSRRDCLWYLVMIGLPNSVLRRLRQWVKRSAFLYQCLKKRMD